MEKDQSSLPGRVRISEEEVISTREKTVTIELKLTNIMQLFNSFDPAPFHEKGLDSDAEEYIVSTVNDYPARKNFRLIIYLSRTVAETEAAKTLDLSIRNHFRYRAESMDRQFRQKLRLGRISLVIGIAFLAACLLIRHIIINSGDPLLNPLVSEGLLIIGWVAMWEPVTTFLYGLYPLIKERDMYRKISEMDIQIQCVL
ncbi:MAG: hypothetical protein ABFC24_03605 [Methanoregulaceae archaeon]